MVAAVAASLAATVAVAGVADAASRYCSGDHASAMKAWTKGDRVVQPTYGPGWTCRDCGWTEAASED